MDPGQQLRVLLFDQTHNVIELLFLAAPQELTSPRFKYKAVSPSVSEVTEVCVEAGGVSRGHI